MSTTAHANQENANPTFFGNAEFRTCSTCGVLTDSYYWGWNFQTNPPEAKPLCPSCAPVASPPQNARAAPVGWICPTCGRGMAPHAQHCDHGVYKFTVS